MITPLDIILWALAIVVVLIAAAVALFVIAAVVIALRRPKPQNSTRVMGKLDE